MNRVRTTGIIDSIGNLKMYMGEAEVAFQAHKNHRVIATFELIPRGTSDALRGYYFGYVVPSVRKGLWALGERKTQKNTEQYLRLLSPITNKESFDPTTGEYTNTIIGISDLDNAGLIEHIEFIKQFAAEELQVYIEDPTII